MNYHTFKIVSGEAPHISLLMYVQTLFVIQSILGPKNHILYQSEIVLSEISL